MGFRTIVIGLFFIFFDFNVNKVNILPDIIGFLCILNGVSQLTRKVTNEYFSVLKPLCILLLVLSFIEILIQYSDVLNGVIDHPVTIQGKLFSVIFVITKFSLVVYFLINMFKGIEYQAIKLNLTNIEGKVKRVTKMVLIYQIILAAFILIGVLFFNTVAIDQTIEGGGLLIPIILLGFIFIVYVFLQLRKVLYEAEDAFMEHIH